MNKNAQSIYERLGIAVLEAVELAGTHGAPSGVMFAAMQAHGATLQQFQSFMKTLTGNGLLTLDDQHCYHSTESGITFLRKLQIKHGLEA